MALYFSIFFKLFLIKILSYSLNPSCFINVVCYRLLLTVAMKNKLSWYSVLSNLTSHFVPKEWRFHANYHLPRFLGSYLKIRQESGFLRQCISYQPYIKGINYSRTKTDHIYTVSQKNCAKMLLSEVHQMSTNFDNFWHTHNTKDRFMWGALIFHLT